MAEPLPTQPVVDNLANNHVLAKQKHKHTRSKLGTVPSFIGGCPGSLRSTKNYGGLHRKILGTAPMRGQSRFCCRVP